MWGTNAGGGALQHDTNPPSLAHPAAPGALLNRSCLTHPVPPGKEDGRSCKKVTIRMTIRKNECRSNTPVRGPGETVGVGWGWGGVGANQIWEWRELCGEGSHTGCLTGLPISR